MSETRKAERKAGGVTTLSPADFLKRKMALSGLNATALAKDLNVHVQTLYNVTTGKRPISSSLALKLSRRFVEPVDIWLSEAIEISASDMADMALTAKRARRSGRVDGESSLPLFSDSRRHFGNLERILVDREIEKLLESAGGPVSVTPYDPDQVQPASYDLTVGIIIEKGFRELSEHEWVLVLKRTYEGDDTKTREAGHIDTLLAKKREDIRYSKTVTLTERKSVVVLTRELTSFKKEYLAEVGSTATNAMRGLLVNHGFQIDPGYSGPIFVTAMNIGLDAFTLSAGDKIVSLAIRRLAQAPDRAYRADIAQRILAIFQRVDDALKSLFTCRALLGGKEFAAESDALGQTHIAASEDEALNKAVAAVMETLSQTVTEDPAYKALDTAVRNVLKLISIDKQEAKALIRHFAITDETLKNQTMRYFVAADDRQTLGATLLRLGQDPIVALLAMPDG
jgi:deoxycytidine triphosphate deaminase/plasmid maintenance system antidote protein VapI